MRERTLLRGSRAGLPGGTNIPARANNSYARMGSDLAVGDINGDGRQDLAISPAGETLGGKPYAGGVHILYGRGGGLTATGSQWLARSTAGIPDDVNRGDGFGQKVRLRDANRDGKADLYVYSASGSLRLLGSASGIRTAGVTSVPEGLIDGMLP